ncbi:DedA family protein [Paenibacillus aurantius]|uniref:DedA family protein n=1 Tax=Paenibacillus aurantius TaxID=2918900 RepID=A0AA96RDR4_9BACL|nr:DedA family protein [Paenibacillus aurantius]WNQ09701.1 DedA family protein [Paenibacillus aurantius]
MTGTDRERVPGKREDPLTEGGRGMLQEALQEFIVRYGYYAMYGLLAAGIVGLPVPDEILMTFVGYLTSLGLFNPYLAVAVSFGGAMTGMIVSYYLGKKVGKPFLWKYGKWVKLTPRRLERAESWFRKYGLWTVSFGYFVPGVRHFTCYLAGVSQVKLWKYLLFAGGGAFVWCTLFITLGRVVGQGMEHLFHLIHTYVGWGLFAVIAVSAAVVLSAIRFRKKTPPEHS